ncbi:MAG: hypothetical protein UW46_C0013G0010 [Candidatus Yanofskybacteria bacterium GW2011_GWF1_44_227]|uniref:Uncharacterized protein n=1 Tax=Candidatus Yanofskybacteria bacterium GW2011_GWE2_40_11 TaxID=1619033 RepID=A0A0G0QI33_9BACT|nr:MAG: hypothetical protein UT75_C0013G0020 [Candidatus Yanofskybacteria bacterium GW2011_GWE2_40_11]KKT14936.1 MAG: hypothetical protein UV97_C0014G0010 [Candidatus Yanofskybacteria bacterium GW2011_GWF2_43_596]KKT20775.1 MAG: hypothetical protein UW06_C0055G0008 [Parcubacteria group bacterium GW2011_GWE1_43_8]KKT52709.1 MAG: hypothetical protein UW46_C0013G0010 [Candidatus Yanofskybacteria bacterium GW2011_GWF1_44_227]OGN35811.1 MAG: hypothetical protein A2207_03860 [Candidatus Yanofskybacte
MSPDILSKIPVGQIIVGAFFVFYWIQAFFIIYHLVRFGIGVKPKVVALIYFVGAIILYTLVSSGVSQLSFDGLAGLFDGVVNPDFMREVDPFNMISK